MIDLAPRYLEEVLRILRIHAPGVEARAFGSRVDGTAWKWSDLDVALVGEQPLDWRTVEALKEAFSESDLPFSVDVVDWAAAPPAFRRAVGERFVLLQ